MIRMKTEAVVITKPDKNTNLNGCNINMNGKVLLTEAADKGYKGAGTLSGEIVLAVASGDRETKAAETAMQILSKHLAAIKSSGESFPAEADSFFNHAFRELSMQKGAYEAFSATLLYHFQDNVYIANTGDNAVYVYDGTYLDQIPFAEEENDKKDAELPTSDVYCKIIPNIQPNTEVLVLSKEVYEYTTDEQIMDILRNAISPKQACQKLVDQANENGAESAVAVLLENLTPVEVPVAGAVAETPEDAAADEPAEEQQDLTKPSKAPLIVLILLLILVALVAGLYFANQRYGFIDRLTAGRTTEQETESEPSISEPAANLITLPSNSRPTEPSASVSDESETETDAKDEEDNEETRRAITTTRRTTTTRRPTEAPRTDPPQTDPPETDAPTEAPNNEPSDETPDSGDTPSADEPSNDEPPAVEAPENGELEDR